MSRIEVQLLCTPIIRVNGQQITFPLKKADALFFYMIVKKNATRTELSNLLWGGQSEISSKKNLRNALYVIKKAFGFDPFESPKQQILKLNHEVEFDVDYDRFHETRDLSLHQDEFLHGFSLKDSYEFDEWMNVTRAHTLDLFLQQIFQEFQQVPVDRIAERERLFRLYTATDPMDERIHMCMMETYVQNKLYLKSIKCYENLVQVLKTELNLTPSADIVNLHKMTLQNWKEENSTDLSAEGNTGTPLLSARSKEMQVLNHAFLQLLTHSGSCIFVTGEQGVGKTYLCQRFLETLNEESCLSLSVSCYDTESTISLYVWNCLLMQIRQQVQDKHVPVPQSIRDTITALIPMLEAINSSEDSTQEITATYSARTIRNHVMRLFSLLSETIPIILYLDGIESIDDMSLEWLSAMIRSENENLMILCTCSLYPEHRIERFINTMVCRKNVSKLILNRFTLDDVKEFLRVNNPEMNVSEEKITQIYLESKGNPFYLGLLTENLVQDSSSNHIRALDILAARLSQLPPAEYQLLELISLFQDFATLDLLQSITGGDPIQILSMTDHMKQREIISETVDSSQIRFTCIHPAIRDYVQNKMSPSKARLYHNRIAAYLEGFRTPLTAKRISYLIDHYTQGGNFPKALYYKIRQLEIFIRMHYELYPTIDLQKDAGSEIDSGAGIFQRFADLEQELILSYQREPDQIDYPEAEARLYLIIGKTHILQATYDKGLPYIAHALKNNSYVQREPKIRLLFHRQQIFYAIQTWNLPLMEEAVSRCLSIDEEIGDSCQTAVDLRLKGLFLSMSGQFEESDRMLEQAIRTFRFTPLALHTYGMNLAACYNYQSMNARLQNDFESALMLIKKAVRTCTDMKISVNPTFYTNMASCYYGLKDMKHVRESLEQALPLYRSVGSYMGRAQMYLLMAQYHMADGQPEKALPLLKHGGELAERVGYLPSLCHYYRVVLLFKKQFPEESLHEFPESDEFYESCIPSITPGWLQYFTNLT